jgi:hypothetical protein
MKTPAITGIIDRRVLVNFTVEPEIVSKILPTVFKPKIYKGKAIVGICLIRLKHIRPKGLPAFIGVSSENGAHRIAVEWEDNGATKEGVFIPRRDTSSYFNYVAGGRIFPGKHYRANFDVQEQHDHYHIAFKSSDGTTIAVDGKKADHLPENSIFGTLEEASKFFEAGATGYSPNGNTLEGLQLKTFHWKVNPLQVTHVQSSFFSDRHIFPEGAVVFDNALLMTNMEHEWYSVGQKEACL